MFIYNNKKYGVVQYFVKTYLLDLYTCYCLNQNLVVQCKLINIVALIRTANGFENNLAFVRCRDQSIATVCLRLSYSPRNTKIAAINDIINYLRALHLYWQYVYSYCSAVQSSPQRSETFDYCYYYVIHCKHYLERNMDNICQT